MAKTNTTRGTRGRYVPKHPEKVIGNPNQIFFRSKWEIVVMKFFDMSTSVQRWGSEILPIKYVSPKDQRVHTY